MIYAVKVGIQDFDLSKITLTEVFSYCEKRFGFSGAKWDETKEGFDLEALGEELDKSGVSFELYDDE